MPRMESVPLRRRFSVSMAPHSITIMARFYGQTPFLLIHVQSSGAERTPCRSILRNLDSVTLVLNCYRMPSAGLPLRQPELACELEVLVGKKLKGALVFNLPHACTMADMLREDLGAARQAWLDTKKNPQARMEADECDFLKSVDSDDERIDFHSLRHTCATWLIHAGADVKTIQSVMRHADIKLTLDKYGHLFPGSEADAVAKLRFAFHSNAALLASAQ